MSGARIVLGSDRDQTRKKIVPHKGLPFIVKAEDFMGPASGKMSQMRAKHAVALKGYRLHRLEIRTCETSRSVPP